MSGSLVAIVGRPNVGKSTLFNRLTSARTAIVEKMPGITRDRLYGLVEWRGRQFTIIDTGGITFEREDLLSDQVRRQAELAIEEAAIILFILDAREGLTPFDQEIASFLRRSKKVVIPVANKVDTFDDQYHIYTLFSLGLGDPQPVSASHGRGIGDLLDCIYNVLPDQDEAAYPLDAIKVAVMGRPNVGKSSLVNTILGEERVIVSEQPGTTREAVDTWFTYQKQSYILIDTAGVRRKSQVKEKVEYYSVLRSLTAVDRSDIALLLLDGQNGVTEQDIKLAGYIDRAGRGLVLVINKWDLVERKEEARQQFEDEIRHKISFAGYAPVISISALTGRRVERLFPVINKIWEQQRKRLPTSWLNQLISDAVAMTPPPTVKGQRLKIYYATQPQVCPPTFVLFVNEPRLMHFSYLRYLENRLRESFEYFGTPIRFVLNKRSRKGEWR
ncbi:MAG TPA: ribosome biogenesis GTPase Der [Firmicutes bacterium]|nr:ribosome biogenesis GTPase Der [Bacillota bacterium]